MMSALIAEGGTTSEILPIKPLGSLALKNVLSHTYCSHHLPTSSQSKNKVYFLNLCYKYFEAYLLINKQAYTIVLVDKKKIRKDNI